MSVESMEEALGIKFKREYGEVLPPITGIKDSSSARLSDIDIEWVPVIQSEVEPQ